MRLPWSVTQLESADLRDWLSILPVRSMRQRRGRAVFHRLQVRSQPAVVYIKQINDSHVFRKPIVTQIVPPNDEFYTGKAYQQNYAVKPLQPVHRRCLSCKVEKPRKMFSGCVRKRKEA